jgi:hypothetical protein
MTAEEKIRFTIAEYCHRTDSGDFDGVTGRRDPAAPVAQAEALRRLTIGS